MAQYHVGCGNFGIYAGILKPNGEEWRNKSDVTHEAICAVAQYLLFRDKEFRFEFNGVGYALRVEKTENEP